MGRVAECPKGSATGPSGPCDAQCSPRRPSSIGKVEVMRMPVDEISGLMGFEFPILRRQNVTASSTLVFSSANMVENGTPLN